MSASLPACCCGTQDPAQGDRLVTFSFNEVNGMDGEMVMYEYDTAFNLLHKTKAVLPGGLAYASGCLADDCCC